MITTLHKPTPDSVEEEPLWRTEQLCSDQVTPELITYEDQSTAVSSGHPGAVTTKLTDRRRLYNDAFKEDALRQIHSGVSIRKLSQLLGITQVTLHKWKKEVRSHASEAATPCPEDDGSHRRIQVIEHQLNVVKEERDTLKKALLILLRPD